MNAQTKNDQPDVQTDMAAPSSPGDLPREEIARRAYALYHERGCCDGCDVDDWLQAEAEVLAARAKPAGAPAAGQPPAITEAARRGKTSA